MVRLDAGAMGHAFHQGELEGELEKVLRYIDNQETHHRLGKLSDVLERTDGEEEQP